MPMTLPIISGTTIISRKCVFTVAGFSLGGASVLALRSLVINVAARRLRPRPKRRLTRAWTSCVNYPKVREVKKVERTASSEDLSRRSSRLTPLYEYLWNWCFFLSWAAWIASVSSAMMNEGRCDCFLHYLFIYFMEKYKTTPHFSQNYKNTPWPLLAPNVF